MDIPYPLFFSRYKKARQKARKILESTKDFHIPQELPPQPSSPPPDSPRGKRGILIGIVSLFLLAMLGVVGYFFFHKQAPLPTLKYSFLYGSAQVSSPKRVFFRTRGDEQTLISQESQTISTGKKPAIIHLARHFLMELGRETKIQLIYSPSQMSLRLIQGQIFLKADSALKIEMGQFNLICSRGIGAFGFSKSDPKLIEIQIFRGIFRKDQGEKLPSKSSFFIRDGRIISRGKAKLPPWVIRVQGLDWDKLKKRLASSPKVVPRPPQQPRHSKNPPKIPNNPQGPKRPPYAYTQPLWKKNLTSQLNTKGITLEFQETTLDSLITQISTATGLKISLDPSLSFELRQKTLSAIHWKKKTLSQALAWITAQIPSVHLLLDQRQIWLVTKDYIPHLEKGEAVLVVFTYLRELSSLPKKIISLPEELQLKMATLDIKEEPLQKALQKLGKIYGHSLQIQGAYGKKKVTFQAYNSPLNLILEGLLTPLTLRVAPRGTRGDLVITSLKKASHYWREYRRKVQIQQRTLPTEKLLAQSLLSTQIEVNFQRVQPWQILEELQQRGGISLFPDLGAWQWNRPITLSGTFSLGDILRKAFGNGVKIWAINSEIFSQICRPAHKGIKIEGGLYFWVR